MVQNRLDFENDVTMMDLQAMVFRGVFESGDILMVRRRDFRPGDIIPLKVQLVESDRISNPRGASDTETIAGGVEVTASGVTRAYYVSDRHPGEFLSGVTMAKWDRIPKEGRGGTPLSRLLFEKRRPGQRRGVPALAPVIEPLKQITRLTDYELAASVVSALFTVFIKSEAPLSGSLPVAPEGSTDEEIPSRAGDIRLNPASVVDLRPGEDIVLANPNRPSGAFDPFFRAMVQQIGMAVEMPYEVLMHLYQNSYSAARAALLDAWRFFRKRRKWVSENFCQIVYEWAVADAILEGLLDLPGFFSDQMARAAWLGGIWVGDAPGAINEKDAVDAAIARLDAGLSDRSTETAELTGRDWGSEVQPQRAAEKKLLEQDGMSFAAGSQAGGGGGGAAEPDSDESSDTQGQENAA
jgi:lambda family phage portal protein